IDLSENALEVANVHSLETGIAVNYEYISAEDLAAKDAGQYDVVTCMEMLEHVPEPLSIIQACSRLVKPGGKVFFSTLNRNPKSYLLAIIGAEYILQMLPKGTHDYKKFIKPSELNQYLREADLEMNEMIGLSYNPITQVYSLGRDTDVNYLVACTKK
ncbi:MAG: bifunctional 2-polyprenyl-6-hydroxyphenol methylase/3-demethylubiquinol 3-O-methyltransferase UbiG, partial [Polynucleobacter sp.]